MSASNFRAGIRAAVRGLWMQALSKDEFMEVMTGLISRELWNAWIEGMDSCGMTVADMEPEDRDKIQSETLNQMEYLNGFATDIVVNNKFYGGKLEPLFARAEMWINQYESMKNLAKITVCGDQKYIWNLGRTEIHCTSCLRLNGIVKRASVWEEAGIQPQSPPNEMLECGGWLCDCSLDKTSRPCTPGPLPSLP
jgi:hypothetical protein